uniref:Uncharacterized protein n=1 Tax=Globodera rostochiensis TaxID=31243 RepID=A0A914H0S7_GLORO
MPVFTQNVNPCGLTALLRLSVRPSPADLHIDKRWDGMVSALVLRVLQIETELWRLSTLGGAASAMGFFSPQFTQYAFMISVKQLRLAFLVGDPVLVSRCFLYISLAFAQKGCYRPALKILRLARMGQRQGARVHVFAQLRSRRLVDYKMDDEKQKSCSTDGELK